ncbi:hypothetical protein HYC85_023442 [Camellia sinensis]|uniref:Uncharacterized protein n=1 Tax=Camellia sinensis TaxID=4442 RepID=A0A7J7GEL0_CAMSI|nr:hypothetical protein HYC85_023442 [Camellia sinensis]
MPLMKPTKPCSSMTLCICCLHCWQLFPVRPARLSSTKFRTSISDEGYWCLVADGEAIDG